MAEVREEQDATARRPTGDGRTDCTTVMPSNKLGADFWGENWCRRRVEAVAGEVVEEDVAHRLLCIRVREKCLPRRAAALRVLAREGAAERRRR